jgi:hypothetical protein
MWNPRPLNLEKFSKKIATKAAMSAAASSVVPYNRVVLYSVHAADIICTYDVLAVLGIGETNAHRLINKEYVCSGWSERQYTTAVSLLRMHHSKSTDCTVCRWCLGYGMVLESYSMNALLQMRAPIQMPRTELHEEANRRATPVGT